MTRTIFWDVDTQYDFMFSDGKLYVPEAEDILPQLAKLTRHARKVGIPIVGSIDYHTLADEEIKTEGYDYASTFPPHCLQGDPGHEKVDATRPHDPFWIDATPPDLTWLKRHDGEIIFRKQKFDVFSNPNVERVLELLAPDEIVVYGVAQDVCNRYAIDGLLARGYKVTAVRDAMKPIYKDAGARLLEEWAARGVRLVDTRQLLS